MKTFLMIVVVLMNSPDCGSRNNEIENLELTELTKCLQDQIEKLKMKVEYLNRKLERETEKTAQNPILEYSFSGQPQTQAPTGTDAYLRFEIK